ncbi:hypothetical protein ADIMK_1261 [Marinobacterium lacunae]|uniref:Host attachment protein n=1 Tax=Marinobacterium lacunae TaxID=1232683 RepID=A0A081G203_9GAMM|nr:host attachment protein [Marinobacterium lacunae]KEA64808.1 hypothetical protein ADIMK_1261 [Marinobacterium lacunae]MBR9882868.1 host attachment protein [Oceanospirillales bacterium]
MPDWIVVADASKAIVYAQDRPKGELLEVMDLVHPEARVKDSALKTDHPGVPEKGSVRQTEDQRFARDIMAKVRHALDTNEIGGFYMAAPPHFLGLLRDSMDNHLRKSLHRDLDKNLTGAAQGDVIAAFSYPTIRT